MRVRANGPVVRKQIAGGAFALCERDRFGRKASTRFRSERVVALAAILALLPTVRADGQQARFMADSPEISPVVAITFSRTASTSTSGPMDVRSSCRRWSA